MKLRSLFVAGSAALLLTGAFAPQANAQTTQLLTYFNFNSEINNQQPPYTSVLVPTVMLFDDAANKFPIGSLVVNSTAGTTVNQAPGDMTGAGGALDAKGNTSGSVTNFCFDIGPINSNIGFLQHISLSFALQSVGNGGQFTTLALTWGTLNSGGDFVAGTGGTGNIATFADLQTHTMFDPIAVNLPTGANNQSALYIQFCFTGSTNNANQNHTFIDNIQINAVTPEPATVGGGLLGVVGLCWFQRRRIRLSLPRGGFRRLRRA